MKQNKTKSINIRLNEEDYNYLMLATKLCGLTVSALTRQLLTATINAVKIEEMKGNIKIEDIKAI